MSRDLLTRIIVTPRPRMGWWWLCPELIISLFTNPNLYFDWPLCFLDFIGLTLHSKLKFIMTTITVHASAYAMFVCKSYSDMKYLGAVVNLSQDHHRFPSAASTRMANTVALPCHSWLTTINDMKKSCEDKRGPSSLSRGALHSKYKQ